MKGKKPTASASNGMGAAAMGRRARTSADLTEAARRAPRTYGVLVGTIVDGRADTGRSPHYEIHVSGNGDFRIAVNILSETGSEVLAFMSDNYANPTKRDVPALAAGPQGFQALSTGPNGAGLDYLRDNLFDPSAAVPLPPEGGSNSLAGDFDARVAQAKTDPNAAIVCFGQFFQDEGADETFGFSPERGVHDVHMMQGNPGRFSDENTVNGDGALFIRYGSGQTFAFFARFSTQSLNTDPRTGDPVA